MKKYIVVGLLVMSFIISPVFVSAQTQTSQPDQIATLIHLLQSLVQLLQQQLSMLQGQAPVNNNGNLKTYLGNSFQFQYPSLLSASLTPQEESVFLTHSVAYRHPNPCDFRGDGQPLDKITDFNVSLKVFGTSLKDTMRANRGDLVEQFFQGSALQTSPGFIDQFDIGSLHGYRITSGAEGCGNFAYYFPLSTNKTLFVSRSFISEFKPINADYQKYLNVPGVIIPSQEENFFKTILSSFISRPTSVTVLSPNGGEEWTRGANLPIRWNTTNNSRVDVMLKFQSCSDGGPCSPTQGETIVRNVSGGLYNWIVGNVLPGGTEWDSGTVAMIGNYKIQVCLAGTQTCDSGDLPFKIVLPAHD
jgi:hypothetical protein